MTSRQALANFIREFAVGDSSADDWQRFAVAHFPDELMENIRIRLVRASISDGAMNQALLMQLARELEQLIPMQLPTDYLTYLRDGPPLFGDVACDDFDRYFELWPEGDVDQFNNEYEVPVLASGFVAFGTNGGGELYVFDQNGRVSELPCIGMEPQYASEIAASWSEFEARIKKPGESGPRE